MTSVLEEPTASIFSSPNLNKNPGDPTETSVNIYEPTPRHITEDGNLQLRKHISLLFFAAAMKRVLILIHTLALVLSSVSRSHATPFFIAVK